MDYELFYNEDGSVVMARRVANFYAVMAEWRTFAEYMDYVNSETQALRGHYEFIEKVFAHRAFAHRETPEYIVDFINTL